MHTFLCLTLSKDDRLSDFWVILDVNWGSSLPAPVPPPVPDLDPRLAMTTVTEADHPPASTEAALGTDTTGAEIPDSQPPVATDAIPDDSQLPMDEITDSQPPMVTDEIPDSQLPMDEIPNSQPPLVTDEIPDSQLPMDEIPNSQPPIVTDEIPDSQLPMDEIPNSQPPIVTDEIPDSPVPTDETPHSQPPIVLDEIQHSQHPSPAHEKIPDSQPPFVWEEGDENDDDEEIRSLLLKLQIQSPPSKEAIKTAPVPASSMPSATADSVAPGEVDSGTSKMEAEQHVLQKNRAARWGV